MHYAQRILKGGKNEDSAFEESFSFFPNIADVQTQI